MKSKNLISSGLLLLIIVLVGVAASYFYFNKDSFIKERESSQYQNNEKGNNEESNNQNTFDPSKSKVQKITTYEEFNELATSEENVFFVLGRTGCHYCEMYLPVLNNVSSEYNIKIVYMDFSKFSSDDYKLVMNSELRIPSKCTKSGEETSLSQGFGTPLSLFVNSNKTYDCIRGYKDHDSLVNKLKTIGYIA